MGVAKEAERAKLVEAHKVAQAAKEAKCLEAADAFIGKAEKDKEIKDNCISEGEFVAAASSMDLLKTGFGLLASTKERLKELSNTFNEKGKAAKKPAAPKEE